MSHTSQDDIVRETRRHPTILMSVASMLNPVEDHQIPSPASTCPDRTNPEPHDPSPKKQKLAKDAPIFSEGSPTGHVRFAPYEAFCDSDREEMARFHIFPDLGSIGMFPRHIPYSSDKKDFLQKTGREAFEVFQYTFKLPTDERTHTVMWDYNVGLVRITPFFKCRRFAKTVPGKMLAANPGLKGVCHSITGGALAAQGYWMPFTAARALAATFCYPIRHALLPLFGPRFATDCLTPRDPGYQEMIIDRAIVEQCIQEAALWRREVASVYEPKDGCQDAYRAFSPTPTATEESSSPPSTPRSFPVPHQKLVAEIFENRCQDNVGASRTINSLRRRVAPNSWQALGRGRRHCFISQPPPVSYLPSPKSDFGTIPRSHESTDLPILQYTPKAQGNKSSPTTDFSLRFDRSRGRSGCSDQTSEELVDPKQLPTLQFVLGYGVDGESSEELSRSTNLEENVEASPIDTLACRSKDMVSANCEPSEEDLRAAWVLWQIHLADSARQRQSNIESNLMETCHSIEPQGNRNEGDNKEVGILRKSLRDSYEIYRRKRCASA